MWGGINDESGGLVFYKGEDEAALKHAFVTACAKYHPNHSYAVIGRHVFKGLKDCEQRGDRAALLWPNDLEISERIRVLKLDGSSLQTLTFEELSAKCIATAEDKFLSPSEKRARALHFRLYAEMQGFIKDEKSSKTTVIPVAMPAINVSAYDD